MNSPKNLTKKMLVIISAFLIITVTFFCYIIFNYSEKEPKQVATPETSLGTFCGTAKLSENAREGKTFFNIECAACHKLDAEMTGPALRNTDSITFRKWMYECEAPIDTAKLKQMGIDYHRNLAKNIPMARLESIYSYISE